VCLARLRLADEPPSAPAVMTEVVHIRFGEAGLVVTDLLGNTRTIEGRIESIDFIESTVVVRRKKE